MTSCLLLGAKWIAIVVLGIAAFGLVGALVLTLAVAAICLHPHPQDRQQPRLIPPKPMKRVPK